VPEGGPCRVAHAHPISGESLARRYVVYAAIGLLGLLRIGVGAVLVLMTTCDPAGVSHLNVLGGIPNTAESAIRGSAPCLTSALDQRPCPPLRR
jgi:hypothetical protein